MNDTENKPYFSMTNCLVVLPEEGTGVEIRSIDEAKVTNNVFVFGESKCGRFVSWVVRLWIWNYWPLRHKSSRKLFRFKNVTFKEGSRSAIDTFGMSEWES